MHHPLLHELLRQLWNDPVGAALLQQDLKNNSLHDVPRVGSQSQHCYLHSIPRFDGMVVVTKKKEEEEERLLIRYRNVLASPPPHLSAGHY